MGHYRVLTVTPHLLTSVSLSTGGQNTMPITTMSQELSGTSGTATSTILPGINAVLPHLSSTSGLVLSSAAEPFPRKLVEKVNSGQFVEMRELLSDNIALLHQLEATPGYYPLHGLKASTP